MKTLMKKGSEVDAAVKIIMAGLMLTAILLSSGCLFSKKAAEASTLNQTNSTSKINYTISINSSELDYLNNVIDLMAQNKSENSNAFNFSHSNLTLYRVEVPRFVCFDGTETYNKDDCIKKAAKIENCPALSELPNLTMMIEKNTYSQNRELGNGYYLKLPGLPVSEFYPWECPKGMLIDENSNYRYCKTLKITLNVYDNSGNIVGIQQWPIEIILQMIDEKNIYSPSNPSVKVVEMHCTSAGTVSSK